jgi:hypothetical protein
MSETEKRDLEAALRSLEGLRCWSIIAGRGTEAAFTADFGEKVPREGSSLKNPHLTDEQRQFKGEFSFYVTCAWRIDGPNEVVGAWTDGYETVDAMVSALEKLVDQRVASVEIVKPAWDLRIGFANGLTLNIFCDQTNEVEGLDNYSFFVPSRVFTVATGSVVKAEPREPSVGS